MSSTAIFASDRTWRVGSCERAHDALESARANGHGSVAIEMACDRQDLYAPLLGHRLKRSGAAGAIGPRYRTRRRVQRMRSVACEGEHASRNLATSSLLKVTNCNRITRLQAADVLPRELVLRPLDRHRTTA
jgi:hypothetical protein